MESKQELKRKRLFGLLRASQDRAGLATENQSSLLCPMCWRSCEYEQLSLEHIVPKALRGGRETLTCVKCNRWAGESLDPHLVAYQRFQEAMTGKGSIPFILNVGGHRLATNWSRDPDKPGMHFAVVGKATSAGAVEGSKEVFQSGTLPEMKGTVSFGFNDTKRQLALLKAAYLAVFHRFGYGLIAREGLQRIRRIIMGVPGDAPVSLKGLTGEMPNLPEAVRERQSSFLVAQACGHNFAWVILKCRLETTTYRFAMLPLDAMHDDVYGALAENAAANPRFEINGLTLQQFIL